MLFIDYNLQKYSYLISNNLLNTEYLILLKYKDYFFKLQYLYFKIKYKYK